MDRAAPVTAPTAAAPRRVWPTSTPTGTAIAAASPTTMAVMSRCSPIRAGMPEAPDQLDESVSQEKAWRR